MGSWTTSSPPERWRNAGRGVLVAVALLLLLEAVFRIFDIGQNEFVEFDADLGWKHRSNLTYHDPRGGFDIHLNALGLRGESIDLVRPQNERRVLCLGDSYTFGVGLRDGDTYPAQLERLLRSGGSSGPALRVLNAGFRGYDTHQQLIYLQKYGLSLEPEIVILGFVMNDVIANTWTDTADANQVLLASALYRALRLAVIRLQSWSINTAEQAKLRDGRAQRFQEQLNDIILHPRTGSMQENWRATLGYFTDLGRFTASRGLELLIVIFPDGAQTVAGGASHREAQDFILEHCEREHIACLDLLPAFRESRQPVWQAADPGHPNEHGMDIAATAIRAKLADLDWMVRNPSPHRSD